MTLIPDDDPGEQPMTLLTPRPPRARSEAPPAAFRLDLTIGRTSYEIERLAETFHPGSRAFRLTKEDGTIYDVAQTSYGPECDCPDYIFRRDGLDPTGCKHIKALVWSGLMT
jgi:hypothetical protein